MFDPFPTIHTERLILRQLDIHDHHEIFSLRNNENVNRYLDRPEIKTLAEAKGFIRRINKGIESNHWFYWAISLKNKNKLMGTVCLWNVSVKHNRAEIGYELHPGFQGKGIMQEAISKVIEFGFRKMDLKVILAYTHVENEKSARLLEKCNFIMTGINEANKQEKIYKLMCPLN